MTPACIALDAAGVWYRVHPYEHDPNNTLSYGEEAAQLLGADPDAVFKTLMAELDSGELVVAIVPVSVRLDLKKLAAAFDVKKASMASISAAERSSGYVAGGISPFGQRTQRRTVIDELALASETIFVSGGRRGLDLEIAPRVLIDVVAAHVAEVT